MKSAALLILFSLIMVVGARKDPGEYWKSVIHDQPIPKALQSLVPDLVDNAETHYEPESHLNKDFHPGNHPDSSYWYSHVNKDFHPSNNQDTSYWYSHVKKDFHLSNNPDSSYWYSRVNKDFHPSNHQDSSYWYNGRADSNPIKIHEE